jgi:hypothetical protein
MRFVSFPEAGTQSPPEGVAGHSDLVSRDAVHTLQRVPLVSSRSASLRPLPSYH